MGSNPYTLQGVTYTHKMRTFPAIAAFALVCLAAQVKAGPLMPAYLDAETGEVLVRVTRQAAQYPEADTSYAAPAAPLGRVKIQVYRGPSKGDYDFAPWGYYNTQPADASKYH